MDHQPRDWTGDHPENHGHDWIIKYSFERMLFESRIPVDSDPLLADAIKRWGEAVEGGQRDGGEKTDRGKERMRSKVSGQRVAYGEKGVKSLEKQRVR